MNILYINHYAGSPEMGMEFRPYYLSREWVKMGHKVTIIAGDYSHLRKVNPKVTEDFQSETIDGIEYCWVKTGEYEGNGVKRALTMERFVRKLYSHAKMISDRWHPDVVIASSTYPLDTYAAQRIAKVSGAKYIHEVHDMWPSTLYEVGGMSRHNPFVVVMQIAENSAYRHCDKCVALLPYSKDYMCRHGLAADKFINIQNGVIEEEWSCPEDIPEQHRSFFDDNKDSFIVGYFGGHALSNALDNMLETAKKYKEAYPEDKVLFVLVGNGQEKPRLVEKASAEGLENVVFLPPVAKKAVPSLLKYFDCTYMTGMRSPLYRFGLCLNKMYDSMMAGLPIICAFDAPRTLVEEFDCGIQCSPDDYGTIIDAIRKFRNMDKSQLAEVGAKGHEAIVQHFLYDQLAKTFESQFKA